MLNFNDILTVEGIDPSGVRLVRHHDSRLPGKSLYSLWLNESRRFERYQCVQHRHVFDVGDLLASFVAAPGPRNATLFVGMFSVVGEGICEQGSTDPLHGHDTSGFFLYKIRRDPQLADYAGRLAIEWGAAARSWCQRASRQPKGVLFISEPS